MPHHHRGCIAAILLGAAVSLAACGGAGDSGYADLPERVDFNFHIKPILSDRCFNCHGPDEAQREAGLSLHTEEGLFAALESDRDRSAVVPGDLSESELYRRISSTDPEERMPPPESNLSLSGHDIALLTKWIEQGAEWKPHWSFIPPEKPAPPAVEDETWVRGDLDRFVLARLEREGLTPSPEADRATLLRRVTFDLTGLPPTPEEIDAFLTDDAPGAYEEVVDRLLASPRYGERMAAAWLDVARFADTHGYTVDRYRDMSPWRDWVIEAFNENMPYDRFVTWQLAGDLLPDPSRAQRLATGFNRLHAQNAEGGIVPEEFLVEYAADRTSTFSTAFLGLTMECARCHDHKFDPVTQKEYYELFSFFDNVDESGQISWDDAMPVPTMLLPDADTEVRLDTIRAQIAAQERELAEHAAREETEQAFRSWLADRPAERWLPERPTGLAAHYGLEQVRADRIRDHSGRERHGTVIDPVTKKRSDAVPVAVAGVRGQGLRLSGDDALSFPEVGVYDRAEPFSIGLWVWIPPELEKGVIFHKNDGGILYNFRGYYLSVEESRLHLSLAHTFPYNSLHVVMRDSVPRGRWIHLMTTYDGSSRAAGLGLYVDGRPATLEIRRDNLYKSLLLGRGADEPGLKVGARNRSKGFTGGRVDELVVFDRALTAVEVAALVDRPALLRRTAGAEPEAAARAALRNHYLVRHDPRYRKLQASLRTLRAAENALVEPVPEVMVMDEMPEERQTHVLDRGVYSAPTETVASGTPAAILAFPDDLPRNRLGLAQWLLREENPLFARVTVNRFWQQYFGRGLVATPEDFGSQGDLPTHPALLDWLAVTFRDSGWDVKAMQKRIVLSAAYRQASRADSLLRARDPENLLLARGPVRRLTAEMIRDQALAASGLLVPKIGGPSVKPYQPDGLWRINGGTYVQESGDNLYRRSLYTFWKRTVPPPTMNLFDAPTRAYCIVRRQKTSTPLQALALMNDPQFVEAARLTAERVLREAPPEAVSQLTYAFRLLTGRRPDPDELRLLERLYAVQLRRYAADEAKARALLAVGEYVADAARDPAAVAAHAVVISTLMNYDASVTLR